MTRHLISFVAALAIAAGIVLAAAPAHAGGIDGTVTYSRGAGGLVVYGLLKLTLGLRLSQEEEFDGADLSIHRIGATPDREANW